MKRVRTAVIPAAGFGTRFLPQTKAMPKQMMPIVDKPIIQYVVEELVEVGIEDIIIVTNYHERAIEDHFDKPNGDLIDNLKLGGEKKKHYIEMVEQISTMANFAYVRQKGPYGNGAPLLNVRHLVGNDPFIYTWSDEFISAKPDNQFKQLLNAYDEFNCSILTAVKAKTDKDYDKYGFAAGTTLRDGVIDVKTIIEKPGKEKAPSDLATVSGFLFTPDIFDYTDRALANMKNGDELWYNDFLKLMLADGKRVIAKEIENGIYHDTGNIEGYLETVVNFAITHPKIGSHFKEFLRGLNLE